MTFVGCFLGKKSKSDSNSTVYPPLETDTAYLELEVTSSDSWLLALHLTMEKTWALRASPIQTGPHISTEEFSSGVGVRMPVRSAYSFSLQAQSSF